MPFIQPKHNLGNISFLFQKVDEDRRSRSSSRIQATVRYETFIEKRQLLRLHISRLSNPLIESTFGCFFSAKTWWEGGEANCLFQRRDFKSPQKVRYLNLNLEF